MELAIRKMTDREARECVAKINSNLNNVRSLVLELYEREGWFAMGYSSWRECVTAEFKQSQRHLYEQLEAAQVEKDICAIAQKSDPIPESHLRPLTKLRDNPEAQREAWTKVVETAPAGKVTAAHVYKIVKGMQEPEAKETKPHIVTEAMGIATFIISHLERIRMADPMKQKALDKVQDWIEKHGGRHPEIPTMQQFYTRIKRLGEISTNDESDALFHLKRWWTRATKKDKQNLFAWLMEASEAKQERSC